MIDTNSNIVLGIDIGGSHISSCLVDVKTNSIVPESHFERAIDANETAIDVMTAWCEPIFNSLKLASKTKIKSIGIAMPGHFDYKHGISRIHNVNKYENLFGVNVKQYLSAKLDIPSNSIHFVNDASAFALGQYHECTPNKHSKILGLTLGTGFGSTYIHKGAPLSEFLFYRPFKNKTADDYFSTRWFVKTYNSSNIDQISNVKELSAKANNGNGIALEIFEEFGNNLGEFLKDYLTPEMADACIIGGNINKAWEFFETPLKQHTKLPVFKATQNNYSAIIGAAQYANNQKNNRNESRKTTQFLLPEKITPTDNGDYDIYPGHKLSTGKIFSGYNSLADYIIDYKTIVFDGYIGVFWEELCENLNTLLKAKGKQILWHNIKAAHKTEEEVNELIAPYLGGDDPIFGKRTELELIDFFDSELLNCIQADGGAEINILYGSGAALCNWEGPLLYVDLPKNELQFRMRAESITNLGSETIFPPKKMYKRFYFIDWVVLNNHKQKLTSNIDVIIDDQRPELPYWTHGDTLRNGLKELSENCFRVRPWFEPGVWGGHWMKNNIKQLNTDVPNYAWSFELIVPENGLLFEDNGKSLEVSFDFLMFQEHENILGEAANFFKYDFPIRFDYLDTFNGGNLSVQVHPKQDYFVEEFGEPFTQDECYYMLDVQNNAKVYLGFQEDIDQTEFRRALETSFEKSSIVNIEQYVQAFSAKKHDLYLIPAGTIHGSGKDNLVLEISATPYIFTFKLYDWLRPDLDGHPRPLNIERGFKNLDFHRKGDVVFDEHVSSPMTIDNGTDWELVHLPTHPDHFYDVHRIEFSNEVEILTEQQCHVLALVEGSSVLIETANGKVQRLNFAETLVVPAACYSYKLLNESTQKAKIIKAFIKSEKVMS